MCGELGRGLLCGVRLAYVAGCGVLWCVRVSGGPEPEGEVCVSLDVRVCMSLCRVSLGLSGQAVCRFGFPVLSGCVG